MLALHRPRRHHSTLHLEEARHHSDLEQNKDYTEPRVLRDTEFVTCNPSRAISACLDSPANSRDFCPIFAQAARIFAFSCCDLQLGGQCLIYTVIRIVSLLVGCLNVNIENSFPQFWETWTKLVPVIVMPMLVRTLRVDRRRRHLQQSIWNLLHVLSFDTGCTKK